VSYGFNAALLVWKKEREGVTKKTKIVDILLEDN